MRYLQTVAQNILLIYSHLNPIILLFVLTPFQKGFLKIQAILFLSHNRGFGISKDEFNPNVPIERQKQCKKQKKNNFRKLIMFLSTSLVVTVITCCYGSFKNEKPCLETSERLLFLTTSTRSDIYGAHINFIIKNADLGSEVMKRRSICAEKRGLLNFHYQRCYFIETYPNRGLNLNEQIDFCKSQRAVLSYPRNRGEVRFLWKVYIDALGRDKFTKHQSFRDHWFIHAGFQLKTKSFFNPELISADDLFIVSGYQDYWLKEYYDYRFTDYFVLPFFGPAICITSSKFPMRFPAETRRKSSVCSVDLVISPDEEVDYKFYFN